MVAKKTTRRRTTKRKPVPRKRTAARKAPVKRRKKAVDDAKVEAQAVARYLKALESRPKGRGPRQRPETLVKRIEATQATVKATAGLRRLQAVQKLRDLQKQSRNGQQNIETLEAGFIQHAKSYSDRRQIDYGTWRTVGVPAATLKKAKIAQVRRGT